MRSRSSEEASPRAPTKAWTAEQDAILRARAGLDTDNELALAVSRVGPSRNRNATMLRRVYLGIQGRPRGLREGRKLMPGKVPAPFEVHRHSVNAPITEQQAAVPALGITPEDTRRHLDAMLKELTARVSRPEPEQGRAAA